MSYIQNKLDEFEKKYPNMKSENDEYTAIQTVEFIEEYLTDYHNHIVESLNRSIDGCDWVDIEDGKGRYVNERQLARNIIENIGILQDTNPKEL